jgi:predicted nucleic acid-binding protein
MIYFDASYIARLYFDDLGWEKVRALAAEQSLACSLHGHAETIAVMHQKFRERTLTAVQYRQTLDQLALDCKENAYSWLPLSPSVIDRVRRGYATLPQTPFLRASDALHLACAAENQFREIYSNDQRLLEAATHFGIRGIDIL